MKNAELNSQYVTIWSKAKNSAMWLMERSHPMWYAQSLLGGIGIGQVSFNDGRVYTITPVGQQPEQLF
jgi:hypothetical protein